MRLKTTILLSPQKMPPDDSKKKQYRRISSFTAFWFSHSQKMGFFILSKIMRKLAFFLKLFFGCHSLPARSFFWKGKQFPICARCTGELVGILLEAVFFMVWRWYASWGWCVVFAAPLVIDGFLQAKTKWFSNNALRFFTGAFFGIAFVSIFLRIHFLFLEIIKAWLF